jgi:hypothetical protein
MKKTLRIKHDSKLCDEVYRKIVQKGGDTMDISKESEYIRVVATIYNANGVIRNGGFEYLFEAFFYGDPGYKYTASAFQTIRCQGAARAFKQALTLSGKNVKPNDYEKQSRVYAKVPAAERESINKRFWKSDKLIWQNLAKYIRKHREHFMHL